MLKHNKIWLIVFIIFVPGICMATTDPSSWVSVHLNNPVSKPTEVSLALEIFMALTVLSLAPAILIMLTSFTRIVIVLSMLRHALGLQQTPPNMVIMSLALFLTLFTMMPVAQKVYNNAYISYKLQKVSVSEALNRAETPIKDFMIAQTRQKDIGLILKLSHTKMPNSAQSIPLYKLIPAFMLSELQTAFEIGFVIFIPFMLMDLLVSGILMSMGMVMVPPMSISLPLKILVFILIGGWDLVINSLVSSFH